MCIRDRMKTVTMKVYDETMLQGRSECERPRRSLIRGIKQKIEKRYIMSDDIHNLYIDSRRNY